MVSVVSHIRVFSRLSSHKKEVRMLGSIHLCCASSGVSQHVPYKPLRPILAVSPSHVSGVQTFRGKVADHSLGQSLGLRVKGFGASGFGVEGFGCGGFGVPEVRQETSRKLLWKAPSYANTVATCSSSDFLAFEFLVFRICCIYVITFTY